MHITTCSVVEDPVTPTFSCQLFDGHIVPNPVSVRVASIPPHLGLYRSPAERIESIVHFAETLVPRNHRVLIPIPYGSDCNIESLAKYSEDMVQGISVRTGLHTLGVEPAPGETVFIETSGCPVIVICLPGHTRMVVAKADLDSLIGTFGRCRGRTPRRPDDAIIAMMLDHLGRPTMGEHVLVSVILGVGASGSDDPDRYSFYDQDPELMQAHVGSEYGQTAFEDGRISLLAVIRRQCELQDIRSEHVFSLGPDVREEKGRKVVAVSFHTP
ncbi:MAG: hypothetical protein WCV82_02505 [Candidatus Paceibacterota bacterium]